MAINFFAEDIDLPPIKKTIVKQWIRNVAANNGFKLGEIAIVFVDDAYLLKMNKDFLDHHYNTDIITFNYCEVTPKQKKLSGDLFISVDTIRSNSADYEVPYLMELHRVIIHGILHLCGFEDKTDEEFNFMKIQETNCLSLLETIAGSPLF